MNNQRPYTVSDALIDTLIAHGVTHIFGYPGGAILPFYDALPYHPKLKHILVRHEQGAAFMAQGWARSTKQIGVCCSTSGPGGTNLVTGIADAYCDSIPILAITGQVPLSMIGKDMFQEVDMTGITLNITKHNYLVEDAKEIVPIVSEAIALALHGRPGPVHIDLPKDISIQNHPRKFSIPKINLFQTNPMSKAYKPVLNQIMSTVVKALKRAKRPIFLLGQGVKHSGAEQEVREFVSKFGIPTVTTLLGKGVLPDDFPFYLGCLGMHGLYHCNMAVHSADLILNIGSRFDDRIVGRYDVFGKNAYIIHVDIDQSEHNKVVKADLPIHADAKMFLRQLIGILGGARLSISPWMSQIDSWKNKFPYERKTDSFSIRNVLLAISNEIEKKPEQYIIVTDVGQHQMWGMLSLRSQSSIQWMSSGGSGTMGFALPTAIGAAFANPRKTILCITGDGGIQMNIQELGTLAAYNVNVKVIILNNNFLGMVRQWQELFYDNNYSAVAITSPDYPTVAKAYGIPGSSQSSNKNLQNYIHRILTEKCPYIAEFRVEKEDNVFPMVPGGKHLGETRVR